MMLCRRSFMNMAFVATYDSGIQGRALRLARPVKCPTAHAVLSRCFVIWCGENECCESPAARTSIHDYGDELASILSCGLLSAPTHTLFRTVCAHRSYCFLSSMSIYNTCGRETDTARRTVQYTSFVKHLQSRKRDTYRHVKHGHWFCLIDMGGPESFGHQSSYYCWPILFDHFHILDGMQNEISLH